MLTPPEPRKPADLLGLTGTRLAGLDEFVLGIKQILDSGHREYGETAEAIYKALGHVAPGYAIAEKGIRYARKGNRLDLLKVATYAFLAWEATRAE